MVNTPLSMVLRLRRLAQLHTQLAEARVPADRLGETIALEHAAGDAHNRAFNAREAARFLHLLDFMVAGHIIGGGDGNAVVSTTSMTSGVRLRHGYAGAGAPASEMPRPADTTEHEGGSDPADKRSVIAEAARRRLAERHAALLPAAATSGVQQR